MDFQLVSALGGSYFHSMKKFQLFTSVYDWIREIRDPFPRVRGECGMCGKCCQSLILTYRGKPVLSLKQFRKLLFWDRFTYERFLPESRQTPNEPLHFSCIHLKENRCSVHLDRPDICRTYPHRSIFKIGGVLEEGCGYRVVHKGSFEDILERKLQK